MACAWQRWSGNGQLCLEIGVRSVAQGMCPRNVTLFHFCQRLVIPCQDAGRWGRRVDRLLVYRLLIRTCLTNRLL